MILVEINHREQTIGFDLNDFESYKKVKKDKGELPLRNGSSVTITHTAENALEALFCTTDETLSSVKGYKVVTGIPGKEEYIKEIQEILGN